MIINPQSDIIEAYNTLTDFSHIESGIIGSHFLDGLGFFTILYCDKLYRCICKDCESCQATEITMDELKATVPMVPESSILIRTVHRLESAKEFSQHNVVQIYPSAQDNTKLWFSLNNW